MILEKRQPDEWLSSPSLRVKSSFNVPVITEVGQHTLKSEPFGLGWIVECSIKVNIIGGKRVPSQSREIYSFYILPSSSKHTCLGNLSFRASFASKPETVKEIQNLTVETLLVKETLSDMDWNYNSNRSLEIEVTFPFPPNPALASWPRVSKAITSTLHHDGKLPIDLKFIICTRLSPRGHIGYPKAVFASSELLKGYTPFVDKYINTGVKAVNLDSDDCESAIWSAYDYDADSDFDEEDSDQDTMDIDAALAPPATDCNGQNFQPAYEEEGPYSSKHPSRDSSLISSPPRSPPRTPVLASLSIDDIDLPAEETISEPLDRPLSPVQHGDQIHETEVLGTERFGSIWHVNDAAYKTWKVFLAYLYTHEISFASLKSNGIPRVATMDACSPKSMYRLAVKAHLDGLQELAFENLRSQLTPSNIIAEVFSKFSGQYPKILDMEVKYLVDHFPNPLIYPQWRSKMEEVGRGECPHGTEVMNRVMCLKLLGEAPAG